MANKNYSHLHSLISTNNTKHSNSDTTSSTISSVLTSTTTTLPNLQLASTRRPTEIYSENNNRSTFNKFLRETIKQESEEKPIFILPDQYPLGNTKLSSTTNNIPEHTVIAAIRLNPRDATNGLSMTMTNTGGHLMSTLNPAHMQDGSESYFVSGITGDLTSTYKLPQSSNSNLPSPSSSSNSSNPPSSSHHHIHHHHQTKRHGEGGNQTQKREMRLQKNREAARECRRKKKEYIKCLEERVTGLENQNKALIEELRQLKELYCQREETNGGTSGGGINNNNNNNKTSTSTR